MLWRHAVPNAIGPTLQVIAFNIAYLAGGVIVIEVHLQLPRSRGWPCDAVATSTCRSCSSSPSSSPASGSSSTCSPTSGPSSSRHVCGRNCDDRVATMSGSRTVFGSRSRRHAGTASARGGSSAPRPLWRTRIGLALMAIVVGIAVVGPWGGAARPHRVRRHAEHDATSRAPVRTDALGQDVVTVPARWPHDPRARRRVDDDRPGRRRRRRPRRRLQPRSSRQRPDAGVDDHPRLPQSAARCSSHHHARPHSWVIILLVALTVIPARRPRHAGGPRSGRARLRRRGRGARRVADPHPRSEVLPNVAGPLLVEANLRSDLLDLPHQHDRLPRPGRRPEPGRLGADDQREPPRPGHAAVGTLLPIFAIGLLTVGVGLSPTASGGPWPASIRRPGDRERRATSASRSTRCGSTSPRAETTSSTRCR